MAPSTMFRNWTVTFVESRTLITSPWLSVVSGTAGLPRTVDVRSIGPGGHVPGATPWMVRFAFWYTSTGPAHAPRTLMTVGGTAVQLVVQVGAASMAACRVGYCVPPMLTWHGSFLSPHAGGAH